MMRPISLLLVEDEGMTVIPVVMKMPTGQSSSLDGADGFPAYTGGCQGMKQTESEQNTGSSICPSYTNVAGPVSIT